MRIGWRTDNPPDGKEDYLVQLDGGDMVVAKWSNVNPFWTNGTIEWHWVGLPQFAKVIAWHLLPELYKAESEDKECGKQY